MSSYDAAGVLAEITGAECHVAAYDKTIDVPSVVTIKQTPRPTRPLFPDGGFLILAPILSTDSPSSSRTSSVNSTSAAAPAISTASIPTSAIDDSADATEQKTEVHRRSSSVSSNGGMHRVLKLSPVHNGGVPGVSDYHQVNEE